jgi:glyoxylase-like metal-dependent hydrolase (beta-lactamase superfamily II)
MRFPKGLVLGVLAFGLFFVRVWSSSHAATQMAKTMPPAYYRMTLGTFEVTVLSDGTIAEPVDTLLTNTTPAFVDQHLKEDFLSGRYEMSNNCFLLNTGEKLVLIDAGAGDLLGPTLGKLLSNMKASGYEPEQIDEVYITHMHPDHIGGLERDGQPVFVNATLRVEKSEADYWLNDKNLAQATDQMKPFFNWARQAVRPSISRGKLKTFNGDTQVTTGISSKAANGHTVGHTIYVIRSEGKELEILGDTVHVAEIQFPQPRIAIKFDSDQGMAIANREAILEDAAREGYLLGNEHVSFPGLGHVRKVENGFVWIPLSYQQKP